MVAEEVKQEVASEPVKEEAAAPAAEEPKTETAALAAEETTPSTEQPAQQVIYFDLLRSWQIYSCR